MPPDAPPAFQAAKVQPLAEMVAKVWQMLIHSSSVARWSSNTIAGWSRLHSELATFDDREDYLGSQKIGNLSLSVLISENFLSVNLLGQC